MRSLREAWTRTAAFFRKRTLDRDLDEELAAHVEMAADELVGRGVPEAEARRRALARLGGLEAARLHHREARGLPWLDGLVQDVRYAVRSLRRSKGFTVTAVAMLSIGLGANAAIFIVTNAMLFKGFPFVTESDRVLYIHTEQVRTGQRPGVSYPDFEDWRAQARVFKGMAAYGRGAAVALSGGNGLPESYYRSAVSANAFSVLGLQPLIGRNFTSADEQPGAAAVTILSYGLWRERYGSDPGIVGRAIRIDGTPTTVVGVMPQGSAFLSGFALWVPLVPKGDVSQRDVHTVDARGHSIWFVFGRLADGATIDDARAAMAAVGARHAALYPEDREIRPIVTTFAEEWTGPRLATLCRSVWGASVVVLLIACANLASLLLAKGLERTREVSVRIALGAARWRIARQFLVESLLLAATGGMCGWWLARWSVRAYVRAAYSTPFLMWDFSADTRAVAYTLLVSAAAGLLLGLTPALRLTGLRVSAALKDAGRGSTHGPRARRAASLFVMAEVALAVVLLISAGVMLRSLSNTYTGDMGVQASHVLSGLVTLPADRYATTAAQESFLSRLETRLDGMPGVEATAIADRLPTQGSSRVPYERAETPASDPRERPTVGTVHVAPGYFSVLGAAVRTGRDFTPRDNGLVVLVNERLASLYWPGSNPIGKRLRIVEGPTPEAWRTVVGVVSNVVHQSLYSAAIDHWRGDFEPIVYLPYRQKRSGWVLVRTRVPPESVATAFRQAVHTLDPDLPVGDVQPLADSYSAMMAGTSAQVTLFVVLAAFALLLAIAGLYAVLAQAVRRRTQEIGVRMAMGATARDILSLVSAHGIRPVGIGLLLGLGGALGVTPLLRSQLVQVSPADPVTFALVPLILLAAALLGCLIPARRAMRVDPVVALRHE